MTLLDLNNGWTAAARLVRLGILVTARLGLAVENGKDGLETGNCRLCDTVDVQTFLGRSAEIRRTLDVDVEIEGAASGVMICMSAHHYSGTRVKLRSHLS